MIWTVLYASVLAAIAFGLTRPMRPRRLVAALVLGAAAGLTAAYFNVYPGSVRAALALLAVALFAGGARLGPRFADSPRPLIPRMPWIAAGIGILLVGGSLYPYTSAGAKSVDEEIYEDLNKPEHILTGSAPPLRAASDVRVVPWDLASQLVVRGYGADASFLTTSGPQLLANTFPDTVRGEFIWVHAPVPETSKWLFGSRTADKVVYVRNNATDLEPKVVDGTLLVHVDGRFWQDRVQRYALNEGEFRWALQDVALQLDDSLTPHWIAYLARIDLRNQPHLEKLVVVNAYTGAEAVYDVDPARIDEIPAWIEMVYPETYVYSWASYWGAYREGIVYRWFDAGRLVEPDDVTVRYILLGGQNYWLLPMRQLNSPQLGGYVLVNTRTGDATFYDRFDLKLVDYATAARQVHALLESGEAARQLTGSASGNQAARIDLQVDEGYLYPIGMADGSVRDAWIFPLLAGRDIGAFAIVDAQHFVNQTAFARTVEGAVARFAGRSLGEPAGGGGGNDTAEPERLRVLEGLDQGDRVVVNLNGTYHNVARDDLAAGRRAEPQREFDELKIAVARANRGAGDVEVDVLVVAGRVVDVTLPGVAWA